MNDSLKRTLALVVFSAVVWGGWYGWQSWKTRQALEALEDVVRSADLNKLLSDPPEEVKNSVDLAVRGIQLSQGHEGRKSFDLNADWATLNQDSGAITVREPDIQYMLESTDGEEERVIRATSDVGRVEDGNQKVSMSGNVQATYEENVLTGGFGEQVMDYVSRAALDVHVRNIGIPDEYVEHGNVEVLRKETGLDRETVVKQIVTDYLRLMENNGKGN